MNKHSFLENLKDPEKLDKETIAQLMDLVQQFHYSSLVHTMLAINLYKENHIIYDSQLKMAACLAPDRNILRLHIDKMSGFREKQIYRTNSGQKQKKNQQKLLPQNLKKTSQFLNKSR